MAPPGFCLPHPSPAPEFVVDLAIAHGKPFAVVPCCVYPADFPRWVGGCPGAATLVLLRRLGGFFCTCARPLSSWAPPLSRLFGCRRTLCGRPVTSYEQFCEYLAAKDPGRIRVATLPFEGRNRVLYRLAP